MRVAFVSQPLDGVLPPMQNSVGIWTYEVARRLAAKHHVTVYTRRERLDKSAEVHDGVTYRGISRRVDKVLQSLMERLWTAPPVRRPMFSSSFYDLAYGMQVAMDLARRRCDLVHISNITQFVPLVRLFNPRCRIVLRMTCEWLSQLDRDMMQSRLRHVDCILGNGQYVTDKIRDAFPQYAQRCGAVCSGVDVARFTTSNRPPPNGELKLLFVGRVSPEKGLHVLLHAFKKVVRLRPGARLEIVGPNTQVPPSYIVGVSKDRCVAGLAAFYDARKQDYFGELKAQAQRLKVADKVAFRGMVPYDDIVGHYHQADIVVNPSLSESLGRSLVEAQACEIPLVATNVGGCSEALQDGKTGLLVQPGDAQKLADAILTMAGADAQRRQAMAQAARRHAVENFAWERIVENLMGYYRNICPQNGEA